VICRSYTVNTEYRKFHVTNGQYFYSNLLIIKLGASCVNIYNEKSPTLLAKPIISWSHENSAFDLPPDEKFQTLLYLVYKDMVTTKGLIKSTYITLICDKILGDETNKSERH
jgi:hypothetical protein